VLNAQAQALALNVLFQHLIIMMDLALAPLDIILPPLLLDSANNAPLTAQLVNPQLPVLLVKLTLLSSKVPALVLKVDILTLLDNVSHVLMDVKAAIALLLALLVILLFFFKKTLASLDAGQDSSNLASLALNVLKDVLPALKPTFVHSALQAVLHTMVSASQTAPLDQLPVLILLLVFLATLLVLLALNTLVNVLPVLHVADHSSTSNVLAHALLELIQSTLLANIVHITVLLALEQVLLALHAHQEKFFSMELVMINAPML